MAEVEPEVYGRANRGRSMLENFSRGPRKSSVRAKVYSIDFPGLPLGIDVESAISQRNLFVKGSNDARIHVGSQIISVAGTPCQDKEAPQIVNLIQTSGFPLTITFRYRPPASRRSRLSIKSPRSTARIEFVDGTSRLIPMHDMTVKAVIDFIWATGDFAGEPDHY